MSVVSPSVLQSLSKLVQEIYGPKEKINYICVVEWKYVNWYLALGRDAIYFMSEDFSKFKDPPIPYKNIEAFCLCKKRKNLL